MDSAGHDKKSISQNAVVFVVCMLFFWCCEQGLSPETAVQQLPPYGIKGVVYFKNWPPADSIRDLRLAALKNSPSSDVINEILQGRARYTETLVPYGADSIVYQLILTPLATGIFPYVAVAQQFGPNLQKDWRVVGVYYKGGDTTMPGAVDVPADSIVPMINISVDFLHLPPQP